MVNIKIIDQKDKDGVVIGQYATFDRIIKTETITWNKEELQKEINRLQEKLNELNEVLAAFTI